MAKGFNNEIKYLITFNNTDTTKKGILNNQERGFPPKDIQRIHRIGLGTSIYPVNHSQMELSNTVHELPKCMDESNMSQNKALLNL